MQKVYLDILFFQNLFMNYLILWSVKKLMKQKTTDIRLIVASSLGGLYAILALYSDLEILMNAPIKFVLSLSMILIAFSTKNLNEYFKVLGFFYLMTFIFGGAAFGLFYFTNAGVVLKNGTFYIYDFPSKLIIFASFVAWLIIRFSWTYIRNRRLKSCFLLDMIIYFEQKQVNLTVLLDTGNFLNEPLSNLPVVIVEYEKLKDIIPDEIRLIYDNNEDNNLENIASTIADSNWMWRFRIIPFNSLGNKNGILVGFKPDKVRIIHNDKTKDVEDIIVGIYNDRLSKDDSYNGLLHPEIWT